MSSRSTCLCFLLRDVAGGGREVLLGRKKAGFGAGNVVGLGGHVEAGETPDQAAVREVAEESGIQVALSDLRPAASVTYRFPAKPAWNMHAAIFTAERFAGEAVETEEIAPSWHAVDALPLEAMWDDGRYWLPQLLEGRRLQMEFVFAEDCRTVAQAEVHDLSRAPTS